MGAFQKALQEGLGPMGDKLMRDLAAFSTSGHNELRHRRWWARKEFPVGGRIFAPMAYTVVSALIGSLLLSLTLVPLLCYAFMRHGVTEKENFLLRGLKRLYRPLLESA